LRSKAFPLLTLILVAACAGPAASANTATAAPSAVTAAAPAKSGDVPLIPESEMICETTRPTGSNIAERTCRPRPKPGQASTSLPAYTPAGPPPGGGAR
jgi:hypothetical protein